jgi:uncharacterized protein (DUF1697 family)
VSDGGETQRHVAFLRAINVGGRRVKMARLREIFGQFGVEGVQTYIASGNVVFESQASPAELELQISEHLEEVLGYDVITFVRTMPHVATIAETQAFLEAAEESRTKRYVTLLKEPLEQPQQRALQGLNSDVDTFLADGTELYWFRRMDAGESLTNMELEKTLGVDATRRTLNTIQKIAQKFGTGN